jgi:hypothetical protein
MPICLPLAVTSCLTLQRADIKTTSYLPVQMLPDSDDEEFSSSPSASEEARSPWSTPPSSPHYSDTVSPPLSPLSEAARQGILDIQLHSGYATVTPAELGELVERARVSTVRTNDSLQVQACSTDSYYAVHHLMHDDCLFLHC